MMKNVGSKRRFLYLTGSFLALVAASGVNAQTVAKPADDSTVVVVTGVRGSQETAIKIKRKTAEIVDSIVATDIGKLPDATISDSLQRVPGIQISRTAGEGGAVSIRGATQVMATLNGERFITAEDILTQSANFTDIPSSLVSGVNVYKSQNASQTDGGLGGVIDLRTVRALSLKEGFSGSLSAQGAEGSFTKKVNDRVDASLGYDWNKKFAMYLGLSYSKSATNASEQDTDYDYVDETSSWISTPVPVDLNKDGKTVDSTGNGQSYIIPVGWNSFVKSDQYDRRRLGAVYNFDAHIADGFELIGDVVYNNMKEVQNGEQLFINGNFGGRGSLRAYGPGSVAGYGVASDQTNRDFYVTSLSGLSNGLRAGVQSVYRNTNALNTNLELKFDKGGPLTADFRFVHGDARENTRNFTVSQQTDSPVYPTSAAAGAAGINTRVSPNSLDPSGALIYPFSMSLGEKHLNYSIGPALAAAAADPSAWWLQSSWLETTTDRVDQNILRADFSYDFPEKGISFDFGARWSERRFNESRDDYFNPSGYPGLLSKYEQGGYFQSQNTTPGGTAYGLNYDPLPIYTVDGQALSPYVSKISNFGEVGGLNVTLPLIDTSKIHSPEAFRNGLYGAGTYINLPDRSYKVTENQKAVYFKVNFDEQLTDLVRMSGNIGVRLVNTHLDVFQHITDGTKLRKDILAGIDPNHTAYVDLGIMNTPTFHNAGLPSVNLNFDIGDKFRIKAAYLETQALQNLPNLGSGSITYYNGQQIGENFQRVNSINVNGNPKLNPWSMHSTSLAFEWYPTKSAIVTIGLFQNDILSYTYNLVGTDPTAPDSDGVVRLGAVTNTISQGAGASYHGAEFGYRQSFTFLPGFLSHTGADLNYTYSPSQGGEDAGSGKALYLYDGSRAPFQNTSEYQGNAVLWYQDAKFQARVAINYQSKSYQGAVQSWTFSPATAAPAGGELIGLGSWYKPQTYVDASASYDVTKDLQIYVQGSNLTKEAPVRYVGWKDNVVQYQQFESIYTAGVRFKF